MSEKEQLLERLNNVELLELAKSVARFPIDSRTSRTELVRIVRGSLSVEEIRRKRKEIRAAELIQVKKRNKFLAILLISVIAYSSLVIGSAAVLNDLSQKEMPPEEKWSKTYGGFLTSAQGTSDSGCIIVWLGASSDAVLNTWLLKTDSEGRMQWNKTIAEPWASSVHQTSDGGYIVGGPGYYSGVSGSWLVKTDSNGSVEWSNDHIGNVNSSVSSVQQTSDGGYIIAGAIRPLGSSGFVLWVPKIDQYGNIQWNRTYEEINWYDAFSAQETPDGGYILAGGVTNGILVVKTNSSGGKEWRRLYYDIYTNLGYACFLQISDGGYVIGGYLPWFERDGKAGVDFWLAKIDSNGNMWWNNTYAENGTAFTLSVQQTRDGGYILAGSRFPQFGANSRVQLVKTDPKGKMQWSKVYEQTGMVRVFLVQQTSDREYTIIGNTLSSTSMPCFWITRVVESLPLGLLVAVPVLLTITGLLLVTCLVLIRRRLNRSMEK